MSVSCIVLLVLWIWGTTHITIAGSESGPFDHNDAERCGNTVIKAEARTKYASTPGFPKAFPGDITCTWAIYSQPGKRIRLEFQKFFLLEPVDGNCYYQSVVVKSPFTLFSMGPYCGEIGLPTIISTGNLIYIELTTPVPVTTDNYSGFKIAFKETTESSSYELRPDNSVDDIIMTIDPNTMHVLSPTPPTTIVTTERTTKSTTKPSRWRPGLNLNWNGRPTTRTYPPRATRTRNPPRSPSSNIRPPSSGLNNYPRGYDSGYRNSPPRTNIVRPKEDNGNEWKIEIIVGIAVGGLVVIAIIIAIAVKAHLSRKKNQEKNAEIAPTANGLKDGPVGVDKAGSLPAYYISPTADQIYYHGQHQDQPMYYYYGAESYPMQQLDASANLSETKPKSSTLPASYGGRKDYSIDSRRKKRPGSKSRSSTNVSSERKSTSRRTDHRDKNSRRHVNGSRAHPKR